MGAQILGEAGAGAGAGAGAEARAEAEAGAGAEVETGRSGVQTLGITRMTVHIPRLVA